MSEMIALASRGISSLLEQQVAALGPLH